ncbi:MAG: TraM recognition domain-containing protein, partial [Solirubrobacteraceae bacterium]
QKRIERLNPGAWEWFEDHLPDLKGRELQAVSGLQHRLAALSESGCGHLLEPDKKGHALDLLEAVRNGEVVYFDLHANANHDTATALGALIMSDLMSVFAVLQYSREVRETLIILDDAQAWVTEAAMLCIASITARVASSGARVMIGTQSFEDLSAGDYGTMKRLRNLIKVTVVHGLPDPDAREQASRTFGEREEIATNWHVDKRGRIDGGGTQSNRWVRRVPPDELKHLYSGEAFVLVYPQQEPSRVCVEWVD